MNHTLEDWATTLLADCSSENLLGFSDWLELDCEPESLLALSKGFADEEGQVHERTLTQAARGVRELLVREGVRPQDYPYQLSEFSWFNGGEQTGLSCLKKQLFNALKATGIDDGLEADYSYANSDKATAHLTALLDAAQAWARCNPEPLTTATKGGDAL